MLEIKLEKKKIVVAILSVIQNGEKYLYGSITTTLLSVLVS